MSIKISFNCDPAFSNNRLFFAESRDNCLYPFHYLYQELKRNGFTLYTYDLLPNENADIVIDLDRVSKFVRENDNIPKVLLAQESPVIVQEIHDPANFRFYDLVFGWNSDLLSKNYISLRTPVFSPGFDRGKEFVHRKLSCMIAGQKYVKHPNELYSKRLEIIRWYEKYSPHNFDLYGTGWEKGEKISNRAFFLEKIPSLRKFVYRGFTSFKGMVEKKYDTYKNYRFSFSLENAEGYKGYISEKIFDPMFAGCIPIYLGSIDIDRYVPKNCYISLSDFDSIESLHKYIESLSAHDYSQYQTNISQYLCSYQFKLFDPAYYAHQIVSEISEYWSRFMISNI